MTTRSRLSLVSSHCASVSLRHKALSRIWASTLPRKACIILPERQRQRQRQRHRQRQRDRARKQRTPRHARREKKTGNLRTEKHRHSHIDNLRMETLSVYGATYIIYSPRGSKPLRPARTGTGTSNGGSGGGSYPEARNTNNRRVQILAGGSGVFPARLDTRRAEERDVLCLCPISQG